MSLASNMDHRWSPCLRSGEGGLEVVYEKGEKHRMKAWAFCKLPGSTPSVFHKAIGSAAIEELKIHIGVW